MRFIGINCLVNLGGCFSAQELNRAEQTVSVPGRNEGTGKPTVIPAIRRDRSDGTCSAWQDVCATILGPLSPSSASWVSNPIRQAGDWRARGGTRNKLRYYERWRKTQAGMSVLLRGWAGTPKIHRRDACATAGWGSQTVTTFNPIVFATSH